MNKLKELYYRIKYRPAKGKNGATAFAVIKGDGRNDFNEKLEEIAAKALPCHKTNAEVLSYIENKYNLAEAELSDTEIEMYKVNYIMQSCPQVLETPEIRIDCGKKSPRRKQMLKFRENSEKRFEEAGKYPIEKLGLDIKAYTFDIALPDGYTVVFKVIAENGHDSISVTTSITGRCMTDEENRRIRNILDDITLFKGVTREDIEKRTNRFTAYAAAFMEQNRNGER